MNKTIFIVLDACQYEAGTRNRAFPEYLADYGKYARYRGKGETPSRSHPVYATLLTGCIRLNCGKQIDHGMNQMSMHGGVEVRLYHWPGSFLPNGSDIYKIPYRVPEEIDDKETV